ncbi:cyclic pyranopterin monophosphate synthase MoaC [Listeria fleischmannii]|jgi:cyclic pyranopterin phosphate synthase|uniref:Cyclic pyranopterin monophosphate synthase n=2 Tax=Listeria fleischmannii TaxID=1069827 RepID=W7DNG5_9LIST|nr:cyclic pyranopterin monophosphate synthase MoaC [Listeria fleischmannii]EIA19587.1 molybdenum cofactor biosynthesis protein MoaC [Listeria fleischmannii subsp. coloradonensis]EUJ57873.1 molybdenum cofactor biosynthesis protein MoaC [Listeria fleischmannii FSL S10-1203]MBC1397291.1 cyclic pyranopterin monophosphate synthase MoaC [Listeria fleischmannii]MBC1419836.1 cyclic pyranopterin monophosphate synthase MoaC [Listeria fleischmannii]MBC1425660.1 cyclic pyranopterin monophosphate synthase 
MDQLTHFNDEKRAQMVDVTEKNETKRIAVAESVLKMEPETLSRIKEGKIKKGDVLAVAQVAGIMAAKKTSDFIPMCHPLMTTKADLSFRDDGVNTLTIQATVVTVGKTGVEMEALSAASIAALTIYDMCKAMDRGMEITRTRLLEKSGGKSGEFSSK